MSQSRPLSLRAASWGIVLLSAIVSGCDKPPIAAKDATDGKPVPPEGPVPIESEGEWKGVGRTSRGTAVFVDTTSVRDSANTRIATFRIKHIAPYPKDSALVPIKLSRAVLIAECASPPRTVARLVEHFADVAGTEVITAKRDSRPPWNVESPGTFGDVSVAYLCSSGVAGEKPAAPPAAPPKP
jgi:hypothetical protein